MTSRRFTSKELRDIGRGYAWRVGGGMCHWAMPSKQRLVDVLDKPSPEARIVPVAIVPMATWRRVKRALGARRKKR